MSEQLYRKWINAHLEEGFTGMTPTIKYPDDRIAEEADFYSSFKNGVLLMHLTDVLVGAPLLGERDDVLKASGEDKCRLALKKLYPKILEKLPSLPANMALPPNTVQGPSDILVLVGGFMSADKTVITDFMHDLIATFDLESSFTLVEMERLLMQKHAAERQKRKDMQDAEDAKMLHHADHVLQQNKTKAAQVAEAEAKARLKRAEAEATQVAAANAVKAGKAQDAIEGAKKDHVAAEEAAKQEADKAEAAQSRARKAEQVLAAAREAHQEAVK